MNACCSFDSSPGKVSPELEEVVSLNECSKAKLSCVCTVRWTRNAFCLMQSNIDSIYLGKFKRR